MEGDCAVISGVVEGEHYLVIIHKHRVDKRPDELFLAFKVGMIHIGKLMEEVDDVFFFQSCL